jgi:hypothetical protein
MRSSYFGPALSLSFLFVAGCASGPWGEPEFPVLPTPLMESAPVEPVAAAEPMSNEPVLATSQPIVHQWTDQFARRWTASFRVVYSTDESHEMLAEACLNLNWPQAVETGRTMLEQVDMTDTEQVARWREQLCQDLDAMLFPCTNGLPVGNVVGIEWVTRRTR